MNIMTKQFYQCSICEEEYGTEKEALDCESKPVTEDKGAKIGSRVKILSGQGEGQLATVDKILIFDKYWGHYAWERYWHTIGVTAKLDSFGHRLLTFDDYKIIGEEICAQGT